jgi:exosortase/archaeosortase
MDKNECANWNRRAGGVISILYLLVFVLFEVYSAAATALDRSPAFPTWEPFLGWALFGLPCALLASLFLPDGRHSKLGFSLVAGNLCLYASFIVFESVAYHGTPASRQAVWEVGGIWAALFITAVLAARFLATKTQTMDS